MGRTKGGLNTKLHAVTDAHIHGLEGLPSADTPLPRFPAWMWRNRAVEDLMARLRAFNEEVQDPARQVGFYGLDLYS